MAQPAVREGTSYYALRPTTPIRAWGLAAILLLGGILLAYFGRASIVMLILGIILGVLGLALGVIAGTFTAARTQHVVLDDDGFEVSGPGYHRSGEWNEVTAVNATPDGARLVIACGRVTRVFIQAPGGVRDEKMARLTNEITARLERLSR